MPQDLLGAIQHAQRVAEWMENLSKDEHPPSWMWPFEEELEIWFEQVDIKREERFGGSGNSDSSEQMTQNEFATERRGR